MSKPCIYCGTSNDSEAEKCERCGALLPTIQHLPEANIESDETHCPSCHAINNLSAEYCTSCGTPMAVITRVIELHSSNERGPLESWRVYGIETKQVGRDGVMDRLDQWHKRTVDEHECIFTSITADSGLGKSRLLAEYHRKLDRHFSEAVYVAVECRDMTGGPFSAFTKMLKQRFYIAEHEQQIIAQRKLMEAVEHIIGKGQDATRIAHLLGHLMDMPFPDALPNQAQLDSSLFDRRCFEAVVELLEADAGSTPLILVFEDLQYAPDPTFKLLHYLRRHLNGCPILIILTWNEKELYSGTLIDDFQFDGQLTLEPLTDDEVDRFVRDTLHRAEFVPNILVEKIVDSAHGNPLAVEEMLRLLIAEGTIDTRPQDWVIHSSKIKKLKLPTTVEAAVTARLNALDDEERDLLAMASCVGDVFWPGLLLCLNRVQASNRRGSLRDFWNEEQDMERILAALESLERKDMLRLKEDTLLSNHKEWYFKHRLERKSIYKTLSAQHKQRYHRIIAQWIEHTAPEDEGRLSEFIAHQYDQARCLEAAARRYIEAANHAKRRYANRKAIELYTKGLSYLSDAHIELKMTAFHNLGTVYDLMGEYDQALAYYREMLRYGWLMNNPNKGGAAYNKIGRAYRALGEFEDALECLNKALELFHAVDDLPGIASTLDDIGKIHWIRGRFDDAVRYYDAALSLRRELDDERSIALSLNHIGSIHLQRGEFRDAMIYFREALELRRKIDDRQGVAESFNNLGILCMERGEFAQCITLFEEALEIIQEIGYRALEGIVLNNLGEGHMLNKDIETAQTFLEEALEVADESGDKRIIFDTLRNLGKVSLQQQNRDEALDYMDEALALAEELDSHTLRGLGYQNMAEIHANYVFDPEYGEDSKDDAESYYRQAIDLLQESGSESQLGHCLSSYGNFLLEQSLFVQGKQQLERASDIFKRLEMRKFYTATEDLIEQL